MISWSSSSAMEAMQQEGETSTHDKAKRRLKSPSQVEALENFFREHKYPSEAMKLQFAMKIGLSEKQVSGWFCHRRLKEKKTIQTDLDTNGKQNLSNSAFHDHINEIKQESCSSSKNVDKNAESKEAESRMHHGYNKPSSSSCSSSASHGRYSQINENLCVAEVKSLQCKLWDYGSTMTSSRSSVTKSREHMSHFGHSFVHDEGDSVAIFEIKGKLGRHFREDGPPMGFDFDSLPPGAFHSPALDSKCGEPYYIGNFMKRKSSSFYRSINSPGVQDKYNIEKLASRVYQEQRSFQRANSGSIECNETANLHTNMLLGK